MGPEGEGCSWRIGSAWMLLDGNGENARRYNALWLPRAYALDEQGRIIYVQPETTLDPQAPLQVAAIWGGSRPTAGAGDPSGTQPLPAPLSPEVLLAGSPRPVHEAQPAAKGDRG